MTPVLVSHTQLWTSLNYVLFYLLASFHDLQHTALPALQTAAVLYLLPMDYRVSVHALWVCRDIGSGRQGHRQDVPKGKMGTVGTCALLPPHVVTPNLMFLAALYLWCVLTFQDSHYF